MARLGADTNLLVCQKSKVADWLAHFREVMGWTEVYDLTSPKEFEGFFREVGFRSVVGVINYDLVFRRPKLSGLGGGGEEGGGGGTFTLMLDESSLIQNAKAKRTKFILRMRPDNVILLSGTPTGGKYERLLPQMRLLGWNISEPIFWGQYVDWEWRDRGDGLRYKKIKGYKNEERLRGKMRSHGCHFLKTEEVVDLPPVNWQTLKVPAAKGYKQFRKNSYLRLGGGGEELIGDTTLTKMLCERRLCGALNPAKVTAFSDLLEGCRDRIVVFYNFWEELAALKAVTEAAERPASEVNGRNRDLSAYEDLEDSVTFVQYQAGAMGLNLQKANKIAYFTPPLSSELFEQSKKRIHRIGQQSPCFYYRLVCPGTVETKIYKALAERRNYTEKLFEHHEAEGKVAAG